MDSVVGGALSVNNLEETNPGSGGSFASPKEAVEEVNLMVEKATAAASESDVGGSTKLRIYSYVEKLRSEISTGVEII